MNIVKSSLLALIAAVAVSASFAEPSAPSPAPAAEAAAKEKTPRMDRAKRLAQELNLSEEQTAKVAALIKEENAQLKTISDNVELAKKEKMARNQEIREAYAAKVRELLTPEQQAKFDALRKAHGRTLKKAKKGETPVEGAAE